MNSNLKDLTYAAIFAALICILGYVVIPLPFSPVPITGQSLVVMLAGNILNKKQIILSIGTFLLLGIVGLPVFAGGTSGIGVIVGPRGGYLIGYLIGALLIHFIKGNSNQTSKIAIANFAGGILFIDFFGATWMAFSTHIPLSEAYVIGVLPFLPGDSLKAIISTYVSVSINKYLQKVAVQ